MKKKLIGDEFHSLKLNLIDVQCPQVRSPAASQIPVKKWGNHNKDHQC